MGGINDAEKFAIAKEEHDGQERLAACARALGFYPGENVASSETKRRYKALARQLHPDKDWSDVSTQAFQVLHAAQEALMAHLRKHGEVTTPPRLPPLVAMQQRPYNDDETRLEPQQPPPPPLLLLSGGGSVSAEYVRSQPLTQPLTLTATATATSHRHRQQKQQQRRQR